MTVHFSPSHKFAKYVWNPDSWISAVKRKLCLPVHHFISSLSSLQGHRDETRGGGRRRPPAVPKVYTGPDSYLHGTGMGITLKPITKLKRGILETVILSEHRYVRYMSGKAGSECRLPVPLKTLRTSSFRECTVHFTTLPVKNNHHISLQRSTPGTVVLAAWLVAGVVNLFLKTSVIWQRQTLKNRQSIVNFQSHRR